MNSVTPNRSDGLNKATIASLADVQSFRLKATTLDARKPSVVWLDERKIHWDAEEGDAVDTTGILDEFLSLDSDEDALRFVKEFGPIGFCGHGMPDTHLLNEESAWDDLVSPTEFGNYLGRWSDDASQYLKYAAGARAIVRLSYQLSHGESLGAEADWYDAFRTVGFESNPRTVTPRDLPRARFELGWLMSGWFRMSAASPQIHWGSGLPELRMFAESSFGAIAFDLAERVMMLSRT